jgi:hypothetical protein
MTQIRTLTVAAIAGLAFLVSGCGTQDATDPSAGGDAGGQTGTTGEADESTSEPESPTLTQGEQRQDGPGTVVLNQQLDVSPAEYPLPDVPQALEASSLAELADAYTVVPGIDEVLADLDGTTLAAGERFFAYTVNACVTDDVALVVRGDEVPMVVRGTATLRCEPPTTLVVWVVGDDVPADAKPARAYQK